MAARMNGIDPIAAGTEVRLGRLNRENAETKGRRYVLEGRLQIRYCGPEGVRAYCRGTGHLWTVTYEPGEGWRCSCPARSRCAHLVATTLVVTAPHDPRIPPGGHAA
jgi:uncharacterized Zn finger protein